MNSEDKRGSAAPLYPVLVVGQDVARATEIVRFGGYPFCKSQSGQWALVDGESLIDIED